MMYGRNGDTSGYAMDVLGIASFIMGLLNYEQNLDQTKAQELINGATADIHNHLKTQDEKIDKILDKLEKGC